MTVSRFSPLKTGDRRWFRVVRPMKCEACAADIPDDSAYCNKCGSPVSAPAPEQSALRPRVPQELLREREQRAEAALEMERARLQVQREEARGRRGFMIGIFVLALLGSTMLTIVMNRQRAPAPQPSPLPVPEAPVQLNNIRLARGRNSDGQPVEPVTVLRLGVDRELLCCFDIAGGSGEVPLSVEWWRLGTLEQRAEVRVEMAASRGSSGASSAVPRCIPLTVPGLSGPGACELRFMHNGRQVGMLSVQVAQPTT